MNRTGAILRAAGALLLAGAIAGCTGSVPKPQASPPRSAEVAVWATSADQSRKLASLPPLPLVPAGQPESGEIVIDPARQGPAIVGFGAAMTDASAHLFQTVLTRQEREHLFADLFGVQGINLSFVRVPIGASDFSLDHYSLDDMPPGQTDPDLRHFSMARVAAEQIPALQAARRHNPGLTLMASPWSAPG